MRAMSGNVRVERDGAVAIVVLDRPERKNALDQGMWHGLGLAAEELHAELPRVVIITGTGGAFCAGMDVNPNNPHVSGLIEAVQKRDRAPVEAMLRELHGVLDRLFALPVPIVAALGGLAYGGGAEIAARCDLPVADPAAILSFSEVKLGLMPDMGGGAALTRLIGPGRAAHMILTARKVTADEALSLGLVNIVSAPGDALDEAKRLAQSIAVNGPRAVRAALRVIRTAADMPVADAIALEVELATELIVAGECAHGLTAFMTRTPPSFPEPE
jgi:enoyl-CoA hydratase